MLNKSYLGQAYSAIILFSVPFDEDDKDNSVWFLDHDYLEQMYGMFKKVNGKTSCSKLIAAALGGGGIIVNDQE